MTAAIRSAYARYAFREAGLEPSPANARHSLPEYGLVERERAATRTE